MGQHPMAAHGDEAVSALYHELETAIARVSGAESPHARASNSAAVSALYEAVACLTDPGSEGGAEARHHAVMLAAHAGDVARSNRLARQFLAEPGLPMTERHQLRLMVSATSPTMLAARLPPFDADEPAVERARVAALGIVAEEERMSPADLPTDPATLARVRSAQRAVLWCVARMEDLGAGVCEALAPAECDARDAREARREVRVARYVTRALMDVLGPVHAAPVWPEPRTCGGPGREYLFQPDPFEARGALRYLRSAVPRPDEATAVWLRPLADALEPLVGGEPLSDADYAEMGPVRIPWKSAAAYLAYLDASAPGPAVRRSDLRGAELFGRTLGDFMSCRELGDEAGPPVSVRWTGAQLVAFQTFCGGLPRIVPWAAAEALAQAWATGLVRDPGCKTPQRVLPDDRYGGTLTMPRALAVWLLESMPSRLLTHALPMRRRTSAVRAIEVLRAAVGA